ncbi:MAG: LamG domain-containing protein, partial [Candidatus Pacebacteria bacterium]|nr:LamG domain-containing protein [Candidatus Paceibacterota bacterium]
MLNTKSIAVTLVLMATTAAVQATDKPQLLFHASYDNGFAADVARGTADATVAFPDSTTLVQGVSGQAVQLDRGGLSYQAIDNLKANMGTIEFWFKPVDWEGSDARTHYLFHTPFNRDSQIIIYRYQRTEKNIGGIFGQFSFYLRSGTKESGGPKLVIPRTRVSDSWKRGEWHYIAATWGNQHAKLFVDGAKVGEGHGELPSEQPGTFWISGTSSKEGNANVIDELRIYDAPLDITSIKARYIAGRRRLVQGQSVTGATPDEVGKRLKTAWLYQDELTQLLVNVDAADLPVPELSELRMNAFLSNADGRQLSALRDQPFNELAVARGTMNTKGMPPGKYQLLVVIRKADSNRPIAQQSLQVERPEAKWLGNTIGQTTEAVAPFTPVQVNGTQVTPWGKQYDVTKALILSQATLEPDKNTRLHPGVGNFWRQAPLLAAPIRLTASLGGNRIALADGSPEVKRTTPSHAVIESTATQGPVRVHNRIRIDDDSIITCDLRLEHSAKDTLSDLRLEIPLKTKFCRWMNWTALAGGREASGAGAIPEGDGVVWSGEFHPHLWLGDDYRGFAYFCDNSRGWHGELTTRNRVTIRRDGDTTLLVLHFVPGTLDTGQPWQTRIGFIATPARPMPPRWRGTELQGNFRIRRIPYAEGYPRQVVYWWTSAFFNDGQSHFSSPRTDTLDLEAIHAAIADNQDKPISHVFYTYPNSYHHPAVRYFYSDWCNRSTTDLLNSLQEGSPPAGTAVDWNSSVCDYWLYQLNTLADLGVDGIYCDDPYTKPSYNNRTGTAFT